MILQYIYGTGYLVWDNCWGVKLWVELRSVLCFFFQRERKWYNNGLPWSKRFLFFSSRSLWILPMSLGIWSQFSGHSLHIYFLFLCFWVMVLACFSMDFFFPCLFSSFFFTSSIKLSLYVITFERKWCKNDIWEKGSFLRVNSLTKSKNSQCCFLLLFFSTLHVLSNFWSHHLIHIFLQSSSLFKHIFMKSILSVTDRSWSSKKFIFAIIQCLFMPVVPSWYLGCIHWLPPFLVVFR